MSRPWKHPKTGVYWLRKRVPDDLRTIVGLVEYKRTLKTKDPAEAKRVHAAMLAELEAHWASLRRPLAGPSALPTASAQILQAAEEDRWASFFAADAYRQSLLTLGKAACDPDFEAKDASGRLKFLRFFVASADSAKQAAESRRQAEIGRASVAAEKPASPSGRQAVAFEFLMKGWEAERKPQPKTSYEYRRVIRDLGVFLGHDDAGKLTSSDVLKWKAHLIETNLHPKTIKDAKLAPLRAILQWGADNDHLPSNPAARVTIEVKRRAGEGKRGFNDDEAGLILRAAFAEKDAARRWIPLLGAYSGARIAELAQLRAEDVVRVSGVDCFLITPEAGSLKTMSSERIVPLHPAIVEAGFLKFAQGVKQGPLFPSLRPDVFGSRGGNATKILGRWVRGLGVTDERLSPNHSWRHRFKTLSRRHGLAIDIANAITGHHRKTVADGYGEFPIEALYRELMKIPAMKILIAQT